MAGLLRTTTPACDIQRSAGKMPLTTCSAASGALMVRYSCVAWRSENHHSGLRHPAIGREDAAHHLLGAQLPGNGGALENHHSGLRHPAIGREDAAHHLLGGFRGDRWM